MDLVLIRIKIVLSISKIAMLTFGMIMLASSVLISNQAYAVCHITEPCDTTVGGLPIPVNESEVFGELAQQYSLWLIPSISAIGIAAFLIKRKL